MQVVAAVIPAARKALALTSPHPPSLMLESIASLISTERRWAAYALL